MMKKEHLTKEIVKNRIILSEKEIIKNINNKESLLYRIYMRTLLENKNQDYETCYNIIKQNGMLIKYVNKALIDKNMKKAAIENNPFAVDFIDDMTIPFWVKAGIKDTQILKLIDDKFKYFICYLLVILVRDN